MSFSFFFLILQVHQIGMTEEGLFDMGELHVLLRVNTISRAMGKVCLTIAQHLIQFPKIFFHCPIFTIKLLQFLLIFSIFLELIR